jgi:glycosyltransferase involved in cell wall biosynthesis
MRVLYSFPHTIGKPGISTTAFHQVEGLIEQGITVDLVCTALARDLPGARSVVETLRIGGRRIPHRTLGVYRAYAYHDWRAARALGRLQGEVDLVHTWPAGCLRTLQRCRQVGIPGLREAPSAHTQVAFEDASRAASALRMELPPDHHHRFHAGHLERELLEFEAADFLLVPSTFAARTFLERGYAGERLLHHRYGYDPEVFPTPCRIDAATEDGLRAVFVGRGEPNKGLHIALRAWIDSGAASMGRLLVCGSILPEYRERIAALLSHPSVHELEFVRDVGSVMRDSDVLLLPSFTEGSALVTYEAQASGCALLVSEAAGAPAEHLEHGLVHEPGDVATLTEHLRLIDTDRRLLHELRARALRHASTLTWAAAGERLVAAYSEGLARARQLQEDIVEGHTSLVRTT